MFLLLDYMSSSYILNTNHLLNIYNIHTHITPKHLPVCGLPFNLLDGIFWWEAFNFVEVQIYSLLLFYGFCFLSPGNLCLSQGVCEDLLFSSKQFYSFILYIDDPVRIIHVCVCCGVGIKFSLTSIRITTGPTREVPLISLVSMLLTITLLWGHPVPKVLHVLKLLEVEAGGRVDSHFHTPALILCCWRRLLTARRSNQSILKEISPEYSLEGLMLKLKCQYFGHLMGRTDSFEKTLMLGKIEGGRRRGRQRMRWLDGITDSMDIEFE